MKLASFAGLLCFASSVVAQSIAIPWSGHGHDPQHTGISKVASQSMAGKKWQMSIDLMRQNGGIHYGVPVITRQNTIIVPVKTGASDGFRIEARDATNGAFKW